MMDAGVQLALLFIVWIPDGRIVPPTFRIGPPFSVNLEHSSWTARPELLSVVLDPVELTILAIATCPLIISL